jgi:3-isopropylmalate/(R)-2-methylmalate dehydratase large subunit
MRSAGRSTRIEQEVIVSLSIIDKIWNEHQIVDEGNDTSLLYVDRHYVYEVSSPQAFESLRNQQRDVWRPDATFATMDHNVPTRRDGATPVDPLSKRQMAALTRNCQDFNIKLFDLTHPQTGVIHVVFPELGLTQPGMVVACGDSHTLTHGALGALPISVTSEVEHILTTQTIRMKKPRLMCIQIDGEITPPISAKDVALYVLSRVGVNGCIGYAVEYKGSTIRSLSIEGRMTLCNMTTEMGAKAAIISPDEKVISYLKDTPFYPMAEHSQSAHAQWLRIGSDPDCHYDVHINLDTSGLTPQVTWGTNPSQVVGIDQPIPSVAEIKNDTLIEHYQRAMAYTKFTPGKYMTEVDIDYTFIGSCTNGRIEDLRAAAAVIDRKKILPRVTAIVVPGSRTVKRTAEQEGLADIFKAAGFQWREPGCSMCLGMNGDVVPDGQNCASTSNRNFENRQGRGVKTFLMSPAMTAAAALNGRITDIRDMD